MQRKLNHIKIGHNNAHDSHYHNSKLIKHRIYLHSTLIPFKIINLKNKIFFITK